MNGSFSRTWIALLLDFFASFRCGDSVCEACFVVFGIYFRLWSGFILHRLTSALRDGCVTFAHTKTVSLIVEEGMDVNAIEIVSSLPRFKVEITGIVPNFGGKCFDITLHSTDAATRLATSGFDYGAERKPLKLLGVRTIHVSVFVAVEYPDQDIVNFLKQYGQLKSENLCRLCHTEEVLHLSRVVSASQNSRHSTEIYPGKL